jgi:hypothetical protein
MIWLGWRLGGCVLMYCSSFRNFTFCFYWFLFSRACLYMCNWCLPLRCLFQCLLVSLFVLLFYFVFIPFLYLFIVYAMWLYFFIVSLKVYVALKWDYHNLFVYWLIVYVCLLIDCIRCILKKISCEQWLLPETIAIGSRSIQSEHKAVSNWIELT